jgi:hypothetical protein
MEAFLVLSGFALVFVGFGVLLHGLPSIVHIEHNTFNGPQDDETETGE